MSADRDRSRLEQWRRLRLRRLLAAVLAGIAVVVGLGALRPAPEPTRPVVVAARAVAAGQQLSAADLTVAQWPTRLVPGAVLSREQLLGRATLGPLHSGEPVSEGRLVATRSLPHSSRGDLVVSVPLARSALSEVLRSGDRVDLIAHDGTEVVRSAAVVAVIRSKDSKWGAESSSAALISLPRAHAARVAQATNATGGEASLLVALSSPQ